MDGEENEPYRDQLVALAFEDPDNIDDRFGDHIFMASDPVDAFKNFLIARNEAQPVNGRHFLDTRTRGVLWCIAGQGAVG